jgi:hypothetical protein
MCQGKREVSGFWSLGRQGKTLRPSECFQECSTASKGGDEKITFETITSP